MRFGVVPWLVLCAGIMTPPCLGAQVISGNGFVAWTRAVAEQTGADQIRDGISLGLQARIRRGPLGLRARYQEGALGSEDGALDLDLVEGELLAELDPLPWIGFAVGPHVRSFISEEQTERWVFFEARVRAHAALTGPARAFFEGWRVLASDVNVPEDVGSAYGIEGGIIVAPDRMPLYGIVRYRAERVTFQAATRRDTVEQLVIGIGIGQP